MKTLPLLLAFAIASFAAETPKPPADKPATPPAKKVTDDHKLVFKDLQIRLLQGRINVATAQQQDEANMKAINDYVTTVLQADCGGTVDQNLNCVAPPPPAATPIPKPETKK